MVNEHELNGIFIDEDEEVNGPTFTSELYTQFDHIQLSVQDNTSYKNKCKCK